MSADNSPDKRAASGTASRRTAAGSARDNPYRLAFRLIGIPAIAIAAVVLYRGLRTHLVLPECDSEAAKQTLSEVLKQLKLEPVRYAPIKTVSSTKDNVVCNAVLPLPDGASVVVADYTFFWQGDKADMRYSIHREAQKKSSLEPQPKPKPQAHAVL
jgi:hypothetical protein